MKKIKSYHLHVILLASLMVILYPRPTEAQQCEAIIPPGGGGAQLCPTGQYIWKVNANGTVECKTPSIPLPNTVSVCKSPPPNASQGSFTTCNCPSNSTLLSRVKSPCTATAAQGGCSAISIVKGSSPFFYTKRGACCVCQPN